MTVLPSIDQRQQKGNSATGYHETSPSGKPLSLDGEEELPTNVSSEEQLAGLPTECISATDPSKPLRHVDDKGNVSYYSLRPMSTSVCCILIVELLERFAYYGIYYTQTLYLTGVYNPDWNAGFTSVDAASFVSISTAVAYTTPFVGAILADTALGDYQAIVVGALVMYLPGIFLVTLTSIPGFLGAEEFQTTWYSVAVLFLWPLGTGMVKSVVNVFGAKQFHPILQSSLIESYYVQFYTSINIGALMGITLIPIIAQHNVTIAYSIPVAMLSMGVLLFVLWTPRYVRSKPRGDLRLCSLFGKRRQASAGSRSSSSASKISLYKTFRISALVIPFCIAYSQQPTTLIVQGTVMKKAFGFIDAATMNSMDAISVLVFGYLVGSHLYPWLNRRGIKIPTTYKFALGSFCGALSIMWALVVESLIHRSWQRDHVQISVLWQSPSLALIGLGEIFAVSAAYEVAFTASSPQNKALASAVNIFCVGGIPNVLCIMLYQACQGWFRNSRSGDTNIQHIEDYTTAHVSRYFCVLVGILVFGIIINLLPSIRDYVDSVEKEAADLVRTPILQKRAMVSPGESTPLLKKRVFGNGPVLFKMGSMRAGPSLSQKRLNKGSDHVKSKYIPKLYGSGHRGKTVQQQSPGGQQAQRLPEFLRPRGTVAIDDQDESNTAVPSKKSPHRQQHQLDKSHSMQT